MLDSHPVVNKLKGQEAEIFLIFEIRLEVFVIKIWTLTTDKYSEEMNVASKYYCGLY